MGGKIRALNRKARILERRTEQDVSGFAFSECSSVFAPGWEVGALGQPDPCPWKHDLELCWATCFWTGQVPDMYLYPDWLGSCANINQDWRNLCTIPDN